jgi:hypothetical protein
MLYVQNCTLYRLKRRDLGGEYFAQHATPLPILANISTGNSTHVDIKITYAEKPSRWGQLAREGREVVQFKDSATNRFVAVSVDGEMKIYRDGHRE